MPTRCTAACCWALQSINPCTRAAEPSDRARPAPPRVPTGVTCFLTAPAVCVCLSCSSVVQGESNSPVLTGVLGRWPELAAITPGRSTRPLGSTWPAGAGISTDARCLLYESPVSAGMQVSSGELLQPWEHVLAQKDRRLPWKKPEPCRAVGLLQPPPLGSVRSQWKTGSSWACPLEGHLPGSSGSSACLVQGTLDDPRFYSFHSSSANFHTRA